MVDILIRMGLALVGWFKIWLAAANYRTQATHTMLFIYPEEYCKNREFFA